MPLSIHFVRENAEEVRRSEAVRVRSPDYVSLVLEKDGDWRKLRTDLDRLTRDASSLQKLIAQSYRKKGKKDELGGGDEDAIAGGADADRAKLETERKEILDRIATTKTAEAVLLKDRDSLLCRIGNLVAAGVPGGRDEAKNERVRVVTHAEARRESISRTVEKRRAIVGDEEQDHTPAASFIPPDENKPFLPHDEVFRRIGGCDQVRGSKISGSRGYFLKGEGVRLSLALQQYSMNFLGERGYELLVPPLLMRPEVMAETAELDDFDDQLYKVLDEDSVAASPATKVGNTHIKGPSGEDLSTVPPASVPPPASAAAGAVAHNSSAVSSGSSAPHYSYLIATAEQPISAYHRGEKLKASELPLRYGGLSTCFRREVASHGLDTKGLFRVHQFEKVEQFAICHPDASEALFEELLNCAADFYDSLKLDYQIVKIVSGKLNLAAIVKCDLEAMFPAQNAYRELVSCSNCGDYQARALGMTLTDDEGRASDVGGSAAGAATAGNSNAGKKSGGGKNLVPHMLNATLCAVQRAMCCIVENYQTATGVVVPEVLRPYMGGAEFIPYVELGGGGKEGLGRKK